MDLNQITQNPEQIKQLITLLQSLLPTDKDEAIPVPQQVSETTTSKNNNSSHNKTNNKFLSMPEMNMHKEDTELDKKLAKHAPVARVREYDPVTVLCRVCGKKETISPSLIESVSRYKCNKCSSSAG